MRLRTYLRWSIIVGAFTIAHGRASVLQAIDSPDPSAANEALRQRKLTPLRIAGVDTSQTEALIGALRHKDIGVQFGAIFLIRERRALDAVPDLRKILGAQSALLRLEVCHALSDLGDATESWSATCVALLKDENVIIRIRAAGLIAGVGDPQGWNIIRPALTDDDPTIVLEAAKIAPAFAGLEIETSAGKKSIDVLKECLQAFQNTSNSGQAAILSAIENVASRQDVSKIELLASSTKSQYVKDAILKVVAHLKAKKDEESPPKED